MDHIPASMKSLLQQGKASWSPQPSNLHGRHFSARSFNGMYEYFVIVASSILEPWDVMLADYPSSWVLTESQKSRSWFFWAVDISNFTVRIFSNTDTFNSTNPNSKPHACPLPTQSICSQNLFSSLNWANKNLRGKKKKISLVWNHSIMYYFLNGHLCIKKNSI